jgi:hypothetical protein
MPFAISVRCRLLCWNGLEQGCQIRSITQDIVDSEWWFIIIFKTLYQRIKFCIGKRVGGEVLYLKVSSWHLLGETGEDHENSSEGIQFLAGLLNVCPFCI